MVKTLSRQVYFEVVVRVVQSNMPTTLAPKQHSNMKQCEILTVLCYSHLSSFVVILMIICSTESVLFHKYTNRVTGDSL